MHSANDLANMFSGIKVRSSAGADALANAMGGLAVGRSSAASGESQRDAAFRKLVLEALVEAKRVGKGKDLKALGFKPIFAKFGPRKGSVTFFQKEVKRGPFRADVVVVPDERMADGMPVWYFHVTVKRPNATKAQTKRVEILIVTRQGTHRVGLDDGSAHDMALARKAIQSVGWQTIG